MSVSYDPKWPIPRPLIDADNKGWWDAVARHELVFQQCRKCGTYLHPPRPMCYKCKSFDLHYVPSSGRGKIYSWVTYVRPAHPGFITPYEVVLVEMEEPGVRLVSNMVDCDPQDLYIGMPVEVVFDQVAPDLTLPKFKRAD